MNKEDFLALLYGKQEVLYRDMPWRQDTRGYYVLVSELMLQQTQVDRVVPKFQQFIAAFPDMAALAAAPLAEVLTLWSGLGYNRRAKYLHDASKSIMTHHAGVVPREQDQLVALPGVGVNTAGAIAAYVYNEPVLFVETNIRTVLLHHWFEGQTDVADRTLIEQLAGVIDTSEPRSFYWAMMDYGTWLKKNGVRNTSASRHYRKQSPLVGSVREVRGQIVRALTRQPETIGSLQALFDLGDGRFEPALTQLEAEGLIQVADGTVRLTN